MDEDILQELEQMERESEIEDILSYRSIAEHQLLVIQRTILLVLNYVDVLV